MKKAYTWVFLALLAVYVALAFILPPNPETLRKYELSQLGALALSLSVVLPITLVYLTALYGFIHVNNYANKIIGTKEGPHFKRMALGLGVLALSLPVASIIGSVRNYTRYASPDMVASISIFRTYLLLAFMLVAVLMIAKGVSGLYATLKRPKQDGVLTFYGMLGPTLLSSIYTWLIVAQEYRTPGAEPYYMADWLVVSTVVIPYVFVWCTGIWAAIHLYLYQADVKGVVYKRAVNYIAKGIAVIMLISILVQAMTSLAGVLSRLELTPVLIVVYLLIALYVVGYGLVARGAKKLRQIEEA